MSKTIWKPMTLLAPVPAVLITSGTLESPNVMTAAWTGIVNSKPPMTYVSVAPQRLTHDRLKETGEFVVNLVPAKLVRAADLCGVKSGRDTDKFAECGLTASAASAVSTPLIAECPVNLECRVNRIIPLGSHDMFLADIVAVDVDEDLIDPKGALHFEKAHLFAYAHGTYYALGEKLGTFGFSVKKRRRAPSREKRAASTR